MAKAIHSMIRVLDLARSIDFYDRALGLKVSEQFEFNDFTLAYLRNEENEFELELTLNKGRTEPYRHGDGYGHLAVCVDNCRAERERLASIGLQPGEVKEFHRDGSLMAVSLNKIYLVGLRDFRDESKSEADQAFPQCLLLLNVSHSTAFVGWQLGANIVHLPIAAEYCS